MHCHKVLLECMERLLLEQYIESQGDYKPFASLPGESQKKLLDLIQSTDKDSLDNFLGDEAIAAHTQGYAQYRSDVRNGKLGKTAQLWLTYMDHVWLVLSLIQSVKNNYFPLYAQCLHSMAHLFFSFGGQNYARYLTYFSKQWKKRL